MERVLMFHDQCLENKELQEKICHLEQQLAAVKAEQSYPSSEICISDEYVDELRRKIQSQDIENDKLKLEHIQIAEDNSGLHVQNQKLLEEASYAKELASAAADELKKLAAELCYNNGSPFGVLREKFGTNLHGEDKVLPVSGDIACDSFD